MTHPSSLRTGVGAVGIGRASVGAIVIVVLAYTFAGRIAVGDSNPFDYFGYFTNLTGLLTSIVLIVTGAFMMAGRRVPEWLTAGFPMDFCSQRAGYSPSASISSGCSHRCS